MLFACNGLFTCNALPYWYYIELVYIVSQLSLVVQSLDRSVDQRTRDGWASATKAVVKEFISMPDQITFFKIGIGNHSFFLFENVKWSEVQAVKRW